MEELPQIVAECCWLLIGGLPECKGGFFFDENGMWNAADPNGLIKDLIRIRVSRPRIFAAVPSDDSEAPPRSEDILVRFLSSSRSKNK